MNETRNNTWLIGIVAVVIAALLVMCACVAGLAVGIGIGQSRARAQLEDIVQMAPDFGMPSVPGLPEVPVVPDMPEMPDMDRLMQMMTGAMVGEVVPDGPADQAGIAPGDLIVAVDGEEITPDTSLADLIGRYAPGDQVTLTVVRLGSGEMAEEEIVVVLGTNPNDENLGYLGVRFVPFFPMEEPDTP